MDGRKLYGGGSNMAVLLRKETLPSPSELLESFWIPDSSTTFHGNFVLNLLFLTSLLFLGFGSCELSFFPVFSVSLLFLFVSLYQLFV